jgi:hypothetical protein
MGEQGGQNYLIKTEAEVESCCKELAIIWRKLTLVNDARTSVSL